jgi:hypothetical protein
MTQTDSRLTSARVHFNWGYHDGAHDALNGRRRDGIPQGELFALPPADVAYCTGYRAGLADAQDGRYEGDSTAAWQARRRRGSTY